MLNAGIQKYGYFKESKLVEKKFRLIAVFVFALGFSACAAEDAHIYGDKNGYDDQLLQNYLMLSPERQLLDLAGEWTATIDGVNRKLTVPSNYDYAGKVVYKRTFTAGAEFRNKHFRLVSFGINFHAEIRINGEFVANLNSAYLHTETDLTEGLIKTDEPNTIEILVNSQLDSRLTIPRYTNTLQPKWYGGIFRELFLLAMPKTAIDKYSVAYDISNDLKKCDFTLGINLRDYDFGFRKKDSSRTSGIVEKNSKLRYLIEVFNEEDAEPVYTNRFKRYRNVWETPKIRELNEENVITVNHFADRETRFSIEKPIFWGPLNPYRYRLVISLMMGDERIDQITAMLGLCKTEVHEQYLLFNFQPLTIRGVEYYEDYPGAGNTVSYAVMEQDILKIKKMGANVIYYKHHPPHPFFLELCNRYGLLVFCEAPMWYVTPDVMDQHVYREDVKNYFKTMVTAGRTNPCVAAWGVGYALDYGDKTIGSYLSAIAQEIRNLDARPIFCTSVFGATDVHLDYVDIINLDVRSNNIVTANSFVTKSLSRWPNRVVLCTYGAQIFSNNQNGYSDPMSAKFQAKWIADIFKKLTEWKVAGGFIRSYNDFSLNRSYMYANPHTNQTIYTSGLMTYDRKDRLAYDVAKALYSDDKYESISIGFYETSFPKTYPLVGLLSVVVFISFYRQSGKFKNSVFRSTTKILSFFTDIRESRVISVWPALVVGFSSSLALATLLSIVFFELRRNQIFDEVMANVVVSDSWKSWLDRLAWSPESFVFSFLLICFTGFFLLSVFIKVFSFAFRVYLSFQQALIAGFWSGAHYLFLIPCVIILQRLVKIDFFLLVAVFLSLGMMGWHVTRLFRILKIVYDVSWLKMGAIFGGLVVIILIVVGSQYSSRYDSFNMLDHTDKIYQSKNYSFE